MQSSFRLSVPTRFKLSVFTGIPLFTFTFDPTRDVPIRQDRQHTPVETTSRLTGSRLLVKLLSVYTSSVHEYILKRRHRFTVSPGVDSFLVLVVT